ncbi:penicillin-binding protein 2 [Patescibacteria group bacterium]|nr:penicillin-binding protein 2 [Patescibacteria group bacterium]
MKKSKTSIFPHFFFIKFFFSLVALGVLAKLFSIQLLQHSHYSALAEGQHWQRETLPAKRGRIYSSDSYPLATSREAYDFYLINTEFDLKIDAEEKTAGSAFDQLALLLSEHKIWPSDEEELDTRKAQFRESLNDETVRWLLIQKQLSQETKQVISEKFNGVYFQLHYRRFYPEKTLAAHILGFVGTNAADEDQGYFGLEGYYDRDLAGQPGRLSLEKDASGNPIPAGGYIAKQPQDGYGLTLTLNRELQYLLEKKLQEGVKKYGAKSGTFILLESSSGQVLAMASKPTFDPNYWEKAIAPPEKDAELISHTNLAISENYEPGSVLKTVVMSAGLQENIVEPSTTFECTGPLTLQGYQIRTWNNRYHGPETMAEVLQHSCNIGASWLSQQLGVEKYYKYVQEYHLGEKTGIDLEGEDSGIIKPKNEWGEIDLATAAFGQGIAVTPLQLATVFSTIANNGVRMPPYIVQKIHQDEREVTVHPPKPERVLSEKNAVKLKRMLQDVVEKGEFKWFVEQSGLDKFAIAGKTGTAQIPKGGTYDPHKTNVTFVGFCPVIEPEFVLLVKLEEPSTSTYSADTAVPLWLEMAKDLIIYFGISPK